MLDEEEDDLIEFNLELLGEDNVEKDTKLSIEQAKAKLRYQGLLLHFFL